MTFIFESTPISFDKPCIERPLEKKRADERSR
jgi:hypothetical protein